MHVRTSCLLFLRDSDPHILEYGCIYHTMYIYVVSNFCLSLYLYVAGIWESPGKMFLVYCKVLEKSWKLFWTKEWEPCGFWSFSLYNSSSAVLYNDCLQSFVSICWWELSVRFSSRVQLSCTLRLIEYFECVWADDDEDDFQQKNNVSILLCIIYNVCLFVCLSVYVHSGLNVTFFTHDCRGFTDRLWACCDNRGNQFKMCTIVVWRFLRLCIIAHITYLFLQHEVMHILRGKKHLKTTRMLNRNRDIMQCHMMSTMSDV